MKLWLFEKLQQITYSRYLPKMVSYFFLKLINIHNFNWVLNRWTKGQNGSVYCKGPGLRGRPCFHVQMMD